ncbi:MAG: hypothetical protein U9N58_05330 [Thermodesulfobacteriota bacterium]|nr:hypothetical protein [Thermodesulfobacteriota bacterium]
MNKIYLSACDAQAQAQAGMIFIYPVDPVKKRKFLYYQVRLDASGVLHDVMVRGIEPHSIFIKREIGHGSHEKVLPVKYVV